VRRPSRRLCGLAIIALCCARAAAAGNVTVTVKTESGAAAVDAIVVLDPLDAASAPSHDAAIIDQVNKRYVPHVSVIRTGTAVTFPNSDHIRHQVYSFSPAKTFNLKLYAGSPKADVVFDKPGLVVLGCNIHDTMVAFVGVVDSPYFGKVSDSGSITLEVPVGHYKLRVWQPTLASLPALRDIEVAATPLTVALTVQLDPNRETVAAWPE
jgi:plastocyanin